MRNELPNRVKVQIRGAGYTIRGKESEDYLRAVAAKVDAVMKQIAAANPYLDALKVAVLTAVNLADDLEKAKRNYEDLHKLLEDQTSQSTTAE